MASLGCSFEDMEHVLTSLSYEKQEVEFSPEELEIEKARILDMHARQQAAQAGKDQPDEAVAEKPADSDGKDTENVKLDEPAQKKQEKPEEYVPKRQRVKPIHDYVAKPILNENGDPIIPTTVTLWSRKIVPYHKRKGNPAHVGVDQNGTEGDRKPRRRNDKFKDYAHVGSGPSGRNKFSKNKGGGKKQWTSGPRSSQKGNKAEDSPFAALAELKLSGREKRRKDKKDKDG